MLFFKKLFLILAITLLLGGMYGCEKEGPAERAGKNIDKALESARDTVDDATK